MVERSRPARKKSADTLRADELAGYIAEICGELALLAGRAQWPLLTYFLNMARVEAESRIAAENTAAAPRRGRARV